MRQPLTMGGQPSSKKREVINSRRHFLKIGGLAVAGSGLLLYSCIPEDEPFAQERQHEGDVFDLGSGDLGILNFAYALEQLEAAFYTRVLDGSYWANASPIERLYMEDIQGHEVIHREFFKAAINSVAPPEKVLPELEFDFSSVDFSDRDSVLRTSILLEDTGVAAYNGAGDLIDLTLYLLLAGKIVSVEARHAAALRSVYLEGFTEFAGDDVVNEQGLDVARRPQTILQEVGSTGFIITPFTANNLPTE
ncbi:ferritin-like domain-containing protein [Gillisia sp. JM1]|uniref:ferritin-like domain-containing protein n=1 Tax=Gillisia sp. JM1 TaxID=1283286 RepID=UPI00047C6399|nr:ferritin-like domain-containing protein [Gillisia sp. JM1]